MTATNACTRHARETNCKRDQWRRPKANNDNKRANNVKAAKPPPAPAAPAPDAPGNCGALSGTDPNEEAEPEAAAAGEPGAQGETAGANRSEAEPEPEETAGPE